MNNPQPPDPAYTYWAQHLDPEQLAARLHNLANGTSHQTSRARNALKAEAIRQLRMLADTLEQPRSRMADLVGVARMLFDGTPEWVWTEMDGSRRNRRLTPTTGTPAA